MSLFSLRSDAQTPVATVAVSAAGEASYAIYGESIAAAVAALGDRIEETVADSAALFLSSNTLVGAGEREVSMLARGTALSLDRPVIFDPNLRLHRWTSRADAAASANACVPGALLVRATALDAAVMTGEDDPERAALALVKGGARLVVITLGSAARSSVARSAPTRPASASRRSARRSAPATPSTGRCSRG